MGQFDLTNLRFLQTTETQQKKPGDEELMSQVRELIEIVIWLHFGVAKGTLTSDSPNDTTGFLIDTAAGFTEDQHNDRCVTFLDGEDILGGPYEIDDTEAANDRIECAGENFYAKGVRSGDSYMILCDMINATGGHDHDWVNSLPVVMPLGRQLVASDGSTYSSTSASWEIVVEWQVYVPQNPSTLRLYCQLRAAAGRYAYVSFILTDSGSTDFTSDTANHGTNAWNPETVSVDASAAAAGVGTLKLRLYTSFAGDAADVKAMTFIWDT